MLTTAVFLATAGLAAAATIPVSVGKNGLTFEPNVIRAQEGDVIEFRFWPRNHSVVAGDFANACRPAADNGFFSGFFPTQPNTVNVRSLVPHLPSHS
jgi:plastocyanin